MPWNPDRYEVFKEARYAPFEDLMAMLDIRPNLRVIDLGCGTGELTSRLADLLSNSDVLGIDNSPEMLARAVSQQRAGLRFECQSIEDVYGQWDIVFSHAAIQWVDNHARLIPQLMALVRAGGQLAVQLPSNHHHPSHRLIRDIASEEPFYTALSGWIRESPVLTIADYAELLFANGGENITIFEKIYPIVLKDADGMAEWTSGTALAPYMERLPDELQASFMEQYRARLHQRWPSGPVFYTFQRILFTATRAA